MVAPVANPAPVTVIVLPTNVGLGALTEMNGTTVIVCDASALFTDAEFVPSDAVTVCKPATAAGTVNVQVPEAGKLPSAFAVHDPDTDAAFPLSVKVIVPPVANPVPVTVTDVPT